MTSQPIVSVIMASYNHERYVHSAMESVLKQEGVSFEFLIEDDGSTDGTVTAIQRLPDPRIRFFPKQHNEGACTTINHLIREARGEFIALINSDDAWSCTDKLFYQVSVLREQPNVAACFGRAGYMDARGHVLDKRVVPFGDIFDEPNHSQAEWLRRFFMWGNCLCHPTMLIRRSCYEEVGLYNNRYRQIPDFDMWTRVIKRHNIFVCDRELITFRLVEGGNTSAPTPVNTTRLMNEYYFVFSKLFDGLDTELFSKAFPDILSYPELPTPEHFDIEKALIFLQPGLWMERVFRLIGLEKVHQLLASPGHARVLWDDYSINDVWFHQQMGQSSPFNAYAPQPQEAHPAATKPASRKQIPILRHLGFLRR